MSGDEVEKDLGAEVGVKEAGEGARGRALERRLSARKLVRPLGSVLLGLVYLLPDVLKRTRPPRAIE